MIFTVYFFADARGRQSDIYFTYKEKNKMKKILSILLAVLMLFSVASTAAFAAETEATVFVSVANDELKLAYKAVKVTDTDRDGVLTINDALFCAHEQNYEGGAAEGYAALSTPQYGLSLTKLWGVSNGSGFGYYVNNECAWSLADKVKENDHVFAFVYTDTKFWSDTYSFFNANEIAVKENESFTLTLFSYSYDEAWNLVKSPVAGAEITVDGKSAGVFTDEEGKATLSLSEGEHIISASAANVILVPPVCKVTAEKLTFLEKVVAFFNMIINFFKNLFKF